MTRARTTAATRATPSPTGAAGVVEEGGTTTTGAMGGMGAMRGIMTAEAIATMIAAREVAIGVGTVVDATMIGSEGTTIGGTEVARKFSLLAMSPPLPLGISIRTRLIRFDVSCQ